MNKIDILRNLLTRVEHNDGIHPYQVVYIGDTANVRLSNTTHVSLWLNTSKADLSDAIINIEIYHKERGILKKDEYSCFETLGLELENPYSEETNRIIMKTLIDNLSILWR